MNNISNTTHKNIRTFKQVKNENSSINWKNIKNDSKARIIECMKKYLYTADEESKENFCKGFINTLKEVQKTINIGGGRIDCTLFPTTAPFNKQEFLSDLEIVCTHRNQPLSYFNSDKKLNFGFGKYKDVNYTSTAESLIEEIEKIKNDLPIKQFPDEINSIIFEYCNLFEAENIQINYDFKPKTLKARANALSLEVESALLKDPKLMITAAANGNNEIILSLINSQPEGEIDNYHTIYEDSHKNMSFVFDEVRKCCFRNISDSYRKSNAYDAYSDNTTIMLTALIVAVLNNNTETVKFLIEKGANVNNKINFSSNFYGGASVYSDDDYVDRIQATPLTLAERMEEKNQEIINLLRSAGGKKFYKNYTYNSYTGKRLWNF